MRHAELKMPLSRKTQRFIGHEMNMQAQSYLESVHARHASAQHRTTP